ncbi:MAG TPA: plastocyanin/azurin family copper-binding protein [Mycobacteriales bacterium]|nr:plastocyanin/azurin family copper-binding protein [Mycobacteriales bacterium]
MRRRTTAVALAVTLALPVLTGCGDTNRLEANPETARPVELASVQPTVFPKASGTAKPAESGAASPSAAPSKASEAPAAPGEVIATGENKFEPAEIKVKVGDKVTWKNAGGFHTVTGGEESVDPASPIGDKSLADATSTHEVTFDKPGTYPYFCQPHVSIGMKGTVVVT